MRVLILGVSGMLGHQLCRVLSDHMETWATVRGDSSSGGLSRFFSEQHLLSKVFVENLATVQSALEKAKPDVVINCIGIVKQRDEAKQAIPSIQVNALFPHQLAELCGEKGTRLIQISTDCVFSGLRGGYTEADKKREAAVCG